jgi:hypothetical protein
MSIPMSIPPAPTRPRVPPLGAFLEGWRRVLHAPAAIASTVVTVWVSSMLMALALPASDHLVIHDSLPPDAHAWMLALDADLRRLTSVIAPDLSAFFHAGSVPGAVAAATVVQAGLWLFLSGGLLDRFARARPVRTAAFFAACGVHFVRFLRLVVIVGAAGWLLLQLQVAFAGSLPGRALVLVGVGVTALVADFARVRIVVEDRRSAIAAFAAAVRFVRRRFWRVLALGLLNGLTMLAILRILFQIDSTAVPYWGSVVLSVVWIFLGTAGRLALFASEVVFFQGELAHAGYTAAPIPVWPDSPAVEAIENLTKRIRG